MPTEKHHKILVVEDEGLIAHDIANRLERLGHTVIGTCGTAAEAVELAAEAEIVLMDIRLDGPADGIAAATEIRNRYHLPVVFLTGQSDQATLERAKMAEPFGYIVKPLAPAALQTSIEIALYKHRTERELSAREAWLRTIFGAVADAVLVADPQGAVVMLNRAAEVLTGWVQADAAGKSLEKILRLADEAAADPVDPVALAILRDEPVALGSGARLISRSGRELAIEGTAAPVKANGMTLGAVLTIRDVSARRWEERQLRQAQKLEAVGRLAAGVSTEYTGLLATIRNQAELLLRQFGEYSAARKSAETIQQSAAAAEQLNRRLAALGARQVGETEPVSVNGLVRRATKLIESVIAPLVDLSIRLDPVAGRIKADPEQIEQVLMGLVMHASATMPEGGRLLIETAAVDMPLGEGDGAHTLLAITHTGNEPCAEKLFEPVSMEEEGVALSMIHAIVTEHGGYISAQSMEAGGCRFEALFPAMAAAGALAKLPRPAGDAPTVLLVEPRDHVRLQIHNYFEAHGYNLLEAADAAEAAAVAEVHEGTIDLLIGETDVIPDLETLRIVDGAEKSACEIRRPFTQQALFERADAIVRSRRVAHA
ncbi:MAG: response regulator [Acidobacteriia bacterium]|nr:response regulator [Terriglobia bacterium]